MKITKKLAFGSMVLSSLLMGFYIQNQIGNRDKVNSFFKDLSTQAETLIAVNYPKDLVVKVENGKVSLNQKLPYCLVIDKADNSGLVFDGSESINMKAFEEKPKDFPCKPMAIIGQSFVAGRKDNGEIRGWQIPTEANLEINQQMLIDTKNKYLPTIEKQGKRIYELLPLILAVLVLPFLFLITLWYSWIAGIVIKLAHMDMNPESKNKYWIAMFFGSIVSVATTLASWLQNWHIGFPFSGTILITIATLAYLKWRETQVVEVPEMATTEVRARKAVKKGKK